jgi:hypothetical protein
VERFRNFTEPRTLLDLFIFDTGCDAAACYMEDAISCLDILPVAAEQWFTHAGYPSFVFGARKINEYTAKLEAAGYRVWLMEKPLQDRPRPAANVIDIGAARKTAGRLRKWA